MAYFPNGDSGLYYEAKFCDRCVHNADDEKMCPITSLHLDWNYQQHSDETKKHALETLWPRDGVGNADCPMFIQIVEVR